MIRAYENDGFFGTRVAISPMLKLRKFGKTPKGSNRQTRPADVIGNTVCVVKIVTCEEEEDFDAKDGKDPAAQAMSRKEASRSRRTFRPFTLNAQNFPCGCTIADSSA